MMDISHNCIVCAEEFNPDELHNVKLSEINVTRFKICESCLNLSDPSNDYQSARGIVQDYIKYTTDKYSYIESNNKD